jgi:hypothetical protein
MISTHVQLMRAAQPAVAEIEALIVERVHVHPREELLERLFPASEPSNPGQIFAEVGRSFDRVDSTEHAVTECGTAPSHPLRRPTAHVRWAANTRARKSDDRLRPQRPVAVAVRRPGSTSTLAPAKNGTQRRTDRRPCLSASYGRAGTRPSLPPASASRRPTRRKMSTRLKEAYSKRSLKKCRARMVLIAIG